MSRFIEIVSARAGGVSRRRRVVGLGVLALGVVVSLLVARHDWRARMLSTPAPDTVPDVASPAPVPVSMIAVPLTIPVASLAEQLENAVPKRFGSLGHRVELPHADRTSIAFVLRRAPFQVSFTGGRATVQATVHYALRVWYDPPLLPEVGASCGDGDDGDPRLRMTVEGPVSLDSDWALRTRAHLSDLRPATDTDRDRCRVTFLDFDLTDPLVEQARTYLEAHAPALDSVAARVDLRSQFEEWWTTLQEPQPLGDSLWLLMRPEAVRRGPVRGRGDSIDVTLALRAHPTVVMGTRPSVRHVPLPPLDTGDISPYLDVAVEGRAGYPATSRLLQRELGGLAVREMRRSVRLDSLRVFGIGGGRIALEVRVGGDADARLYLTGTPVLDRKTGEISIPDLDFDVHTRDLVLAAETWLGGDYLRGVLRDRARWPAAPAVDWIRSRLEEGLNQDLSDDLRVAGTIDQVRLVGIRATRDALFVRASATGSAAVQVIHRRPVAEGGSRPRP